eukprot:6173079-Pleurochrysis_carterae.AAC.5
MGYRMSLEGSFVRYFPISPLSLLLPVESVASEARAASATEASDELATSSVATSTYKVGVQVPGEYFYEYRS